MRQTMIFRVVALLVAGALAGCPRGGGRGGGGGGGVDPGACGDIATHDVGRKVYNFLVASAELDRASVELEGSVKDACRKMARELDVSDAGDTKTVCDRALAELKANLEISVSQETRMVTRYTEPVCTTSVDFTAQVVAECEARASADVAVSCQGGCTGTCTGACDGTCTVRGADGQCAGSCEGTCRGRCSGSCQGYADVQASVECKASAEVRASVRTECTEPRVEVVQEQVTVVDATKFNRAMRAIEVGMPTMLRTAAKAQLVGKAVVLWARTAADLVQASGKLVDQLGQKGLCVGVQLAAAFAAVAQVEARVSVSIEVSAEVSATAGGTAQ
jgi:hypothetical protein